MAILEFTSLLYSVLELVFIYISLTVSESELIDIASIILKSFVLLAELLEVFDDYLLLLLLLFLFLLLLKLGLGNIELI